MISRVGSLHKCCRIFVRAEVYTTFALSVAVPVVGLYWPELAMYFPSGLVCFTESAPLDTGLEATKWFYHLRRVCVMLPGRNTIVGKKLGTG